MTNREIRNDLARSLLGAGVTVGLVTDAIRQRVEPAVFSAKENACSTRHSPKWVDWARPS